MNEPAAGSPKLNKLKESDVRFDCRVCARDHPGEVKVVSQEAPNEEIATQKLLAQGYVVINVKKHIEKAGGFQDVFSAMTKPVAAKKGSGGSSFSFLNRVSVRETIFFSVQLSTLLKAGIPLIRALEIIRKGIRNTLFITVINHMCERVSGGGSFSSALRNYPKVFPWIWVNLVEVGEATGKLPECLEEIAHYQEAAVRLKTKVLTAFFYPGILAVAVTGALTFLLIFIIPQFAKIFEDHHLKLPPLTQIVVGASDILRLHFIWVVGVVAALVIAFVYTKKIPRIKMVYDKMILGVPMMGPIIMQVAVVRFTRSLGTLLRAGVQILQSLEISGRLVENVYLETGIKRVTDQVRSGQGLGAQLEARKIFPVFMTQLIAVGEESGQLDRFLELLSDYYEDLVDTFLSRLTTLLEPIMLVFMGSVIGVIVVAMFMPILDLTTGKAL